MTKPTGPAPPALQLAEQQALAWLVRITSNELNSEQTAEFAIWLSLDPSHQAQFDIVTQLWELTGQLSSKAVSKISQLTLTTATAATSTQEQKIEQTVTPALVPAFNVPIRETARLREANAKPNLTERFSRLLAAARSRIATLVPPRFPTLPSATAVLGSLLAGIALAALAFTGNPTRYQTGIGEYTKITLSDGSVLHLNTDTLVEVQLDADAAIRQIKLLHGEIFFESAADAQRPFRVATSDFIASGTTAAVAIKATTQQHWVEVAQGMVTVATAAQPQYMSRGTREPSVAQRLNKGQKISGNLLDGLGDPEYATTAVATWRQGQLVYRNIALADLITDLNRYYTDRLVVSDAKLLQHRVSTVLSTNNHADAVATLADSLDLVEIDDRSGVIQLGQPAKSYWWLPNNPTSRNF